MKSLESKIAVPFNYSVYFSDDLFSPANKLLVNLMAASVKTPARFLAFIDEGLAECQPDLIEKVEKYAAQSGGKITLAGPPLLLPGGEAAKNSFGVPLKVIRFARQVHLCRHSFILGIGGGALLDAVGFAASMIHRGVRHIRVPTTTLAQNDSGVGVKNGVNLRGAKNFLGTFAPPFAVLNDSSFLPTLDDRDWRSGIAEAYKVACIKDRHFLDWLITNHEALRNRDLEVMQHLIHRCAELHVQHINTSGDPFEFGSARPLDFGHWAAHKLESLTLNELRHGEAVAIGLAIDILYAASQGYVKTADAYRVINGLAGSGLPVWDETINCQTPDGMRLLYAGIQEFREHLGGELHVTLPKPLGHKFEVTELDMQCIEESIRELETFAGASSLSGLAF
ncbi:MAG: 3-dehydroquinate synthase [Lentisphaeria bacterium]